MQVIREHIAIHGGYEINTEGDAFYIAFKQVPAAVLCAMEIQYRLMETEWPKAILKMPGCREVNSSQGEPAFKGPRVRMGIHWAVEGTVAHRHAPCNQALACLCRVHGRSLHRLLAVSDLHVPRCTHEKSADGPQHEQSLQAGQPSSLKMSS